MQTRRAARKLDSDALWNYALRILGQRPYSSAELKQKLNARAETPAVVTAVFARLREYGFADDNKFSETYASARLQNQAFGRMRVLRDLRAKRVAQPVAQKAVEKAFAGVDEVELASRFLERKYRGKNLPQVLKEEKQLAAAYRRLRTAGFSGRASFSVLKRYSVRVNEMEDIPEEE